jgi:hypothetical protein
MRKIQFNNKLVFLSLILFFAQAVHATQVSIQALKDAVGMKLLDAYSVFNKKQNAGYKQAITQAKKRVPGLESAVGAAQEMSSIPDFIAKYGTIAAITKNQVTTEELRKVIPIVKNLGDTKYAAQLEKLLEQMVQENEGAADAVAQVAQFQAQEKQSQQEQIARDRQLAREMQETEQLKTPAPVQTPAVRPAPTPVRQTRPVQPAPVRQTPAPAVQSTPVQTPTPVVQPTPVQTPAVQPTPVQTPTPVVVPAQAAVVAPAPAPVVPPTPAVQSAPSVRKTVTFADERVQEEALSLLQDAQQEEAQAKENLVRAEEMVREVAAKVETPTVEESRFLEALSQKIAELKTALGKALLQQEEALSTVPVESTQREEDLLEASNDSDDNDGPFPVYPGAIETTAFGQAVGDRLAAGRDYLQAKYRDFAGSASEVFSEASRKARSMLNSKDETAEADARERALIAEARRLEEYMKEGAEAAAREQALMDEEEGAEAAAREQALMDEEEGAEAAAKEQRIINAQEGYDRLVKEDPRNRKSIVDPRSGGQRIKDANKIKDAKEELRAAERVFEPVTFVDGTTEPAPQIQYGKSLAERFGDYIRDKSGINKRSPEQIPAEKARISELVGGGSPSSGLSGEPLVDRGQYGPEVNPAEKKTSWLWDYLNPFVAKDGSSDNSSDDMGDEDDENSKAYQKAYAEEEAARNQASIDFPDTNQLETASDLADEDDNGYDAFDQFS